MTDRFLASFACPLAAAALMIIAHEEAYHWGWLQHGLYAALLMLCGATCAWLLTD